MCNVNTKQQHHVLTRQPTDGPQLVVDPLSQLDTKSLKQFITDAGLDHCMEHMTEKADLVKLARAAKGRLDERYAYVRGTGDEEAVAEGGKVRHKYNRGVGNLSSELVESFGGRDAYMRIFDSFYQRMFADPRMNVLFGWRKRELPTAEHGRRLGSFILQFNGISDEYSKTPHDGFPTAHQHAKRCPMRPKEHQEHARFTKQQRDAWLGHMSFAMKENKVPEGLCAALLNFLCAGMPRYGPFVEE